MKVGSTQTQNSAAQQKNWVGNSQIPVPGNAGVNFKDLLAVKQEFQKLKMGTLQSK
jgi:hypothetical protein